MQLTTQSASPKGGLEIPSTASKCTTCIDTGIPYIGTIDYANPLEYAIWGGAIAAAIFSSGVWKIVIPAALLVVRYQAQKLPL